MKIKKAIIPVAGFGTRFLPATKAQPKEMLPVVDKPVIQYLVEEAVASGIEEVIFITGRGKRAIEDHFDYSFELEYNLVEKGKKDLLKKVRNISEMASFAYVRQPKPLGDGHAILCAKKLINDEPVAVLFGDDLVDANVPCLKQLMAVFEKYHDSVVALEQVPKEEVFRYGVVSAAKIEPRVFQIKDIVEKPKVREAPSNLIVIGKYIITPEVFEILEKKSKGSGEIRLADALKELLKTKPIYGYEFEGRRFDCGDKLGFLKATVEYGLKHLEVGAQFEDYIKDRFAGQKKHQFKNRKQ
jgi:UTP--glucose-1-phosphate uridylyltransferase